MGASDFIHRSFFSSFWRSLSVLPPVEIPTISALQPILGIFHLGFVSSSTTAYTFVLYSALPQLYISQAVYREQDRQGFRFDRSPSVNAVKSNPFTSGNPIRKPFKTFIQSYALRLVITWKRCTKNISKSPTWLSYENDGDARYIA